MALTRFKNLTTSLLFLCLLGAIFIALPDHAHAGKGTLYTVQIKSLPLDEKDQAHRIYNDLVAKGHLVYLYRKQIEKKIWVRIHVGIFDTAGQAKAFGQRFAKAEGYDFFVTKAVARMKNLPGGKRLLNTPSAIWTEQAGRYRVLFRFDQKDYRGQEIAKKIPASLTLSSQGKLAVFLYSGTLYSLDLETAKSVVLADNTIKLGGLCRSEPRWSPDDSWIAFFDCHEWEVPTDLWVVKPDGSGPYAMTDITETQQAVKAFLWHPNGEGLFFIKGFAFGTVSVGGILYYTNLQGDKKVLDTPGDHQEIAGPLTIQAGALTYNLATFDENYEKHTLTPKMIPLAQIDVMIKE